MNSKNGKFCRGPIGPKCRSWFDLKFTSADVPADMEFLKEDVVIRYFSARQLSTFFLEALAENVQELHRCNDTIQRSQPVFQVISSTTNSPIAFLRGTEWYGRARSCLCDGREMPDGSTR